MITSVFSKSRPINYILVTILLIGFFLIFQFRTNFTTISTLEIAKIVAVLLFLIGSLFITNFITKKNSLSKDNSYTFFLFFIFLILFPSILSSGTLIISNAFILLALRRLISMHSLITPKEKIFDASLWIFVASLINFWCILFILLVYVSIILHVSRDYRNWILPIVALVAVAVVAAMFSLAFYPEFMEQYITTIQADFSFTNFQSLFENIAVGVYVFIAFVAFLSMLVILPNKLSNLHSAYRKIIFAFVIGLAVYLISPNKNYGFLIYTFVPTAIMLTNLLENIKKYWIKETIVGVITTASIVTFILQVL